MSQIIFSRRKDNKPKSSTSSGKTASGKSRNLKSLGNKIYKPISKNKLWFITIMFLVASQLSAQDILVRKSDAPKVNAALEIVRKYEPDIYETIIKRSTIQLGEYSPTEKGTCWCEDEVQEGKRILWIMLSPEIVKNKSINWIASTIVHEAMHLRFGMSLSGSNDLANYEKREKMEHITIYNYELFFLRRIGATKEDIASEKALMKSLSIPII